MSSQDLMKRATFESTAKNSSTACFVRATTINNTNMNINTLIPMAFFTNTKKKGAVVHAGICRGETSPRWTAHDYDSCTFGCARSINGVFSVILLLFRFFDFFWVGFLCYIRHAMSYLTPDRSRIHVVQACQVVLTRERADLCCLAPLLQRTLLRQANL